MEFLTVCAFFVNVIYNSSYTLVTHCKIICSQVTHVDFKKAKEKVMFKKKEGVPEGLYM